MGKNKIVVVPVESEQPTETPEVVETVVDDSATVEECKAEPEPEPAQNVEVEPSKPKRKVKAKDSDSPTTTPAPKSRGRPKKEVIPVVDEDVKQVEEVNSDDNVKAVKKSEKVKCEDCGKMVSVKTLKYTHKNNCKSKKCSSNEEPATSVPKEEPKSTPEVSAPIETPVCRRQSERVSRMQKRQELIASLASEAF